MVSFPNDLPSLADMPLVDWTYRISSTGYHQTAVRRFEEYSFSISLPNLQWPTGFIYLKVHLPFQLLDSCGSSSERHGGGVPR